MKSIPQITNNTTQTNNLHPEHSGSSNHAIASAVFAAFGLMPLAADAVQEPQPTGWPLVGQAEFSYVNLTGSGHVGEYPNAAAGALPSNWGTGNVDPNTGAIVPGSWLASHAKLVSMLDSLPASPDVLLIGDSITQQWGNPLNEGTTFPTEINSSWQKYFPNYNAVSIGIGGDTTSGVLWRLNHGGLKGTNTSRPIAPKAVVLLIGTNNIGGATNTDIAKGVRACVDNIRQHLPNTRVLVVGVLPRYDVASVGSQVAPLNIEITKALRDLTDTIDPMVGLLDIGANFYNADGTVKAEAFRDKLHLTDANTVPYGVECGYDIYARSIQAKLDALILQGNQGNHYPSIGSIPDQAISPDTATTQIAFSVGDSETDAGSLRVSATSSNTSLVPNANIVLTGSGAIRAVKITPAPKMVGSTIITLQVTDAGGLTAKKTFTVNVGPLQPALVICDDGYKNGWFEAGTAGNTTNGTPVHSGISSTTVGFSSGSTIYNLFNNQGGSDVSTYQSLSFWIHGGTAGGQKVKLYLRQSADSSGLKAVNIMLSLPPFPRNTWGKYTVPLAAFKAAGGVKLQSFMFQSDGDPSPFFIDDIVLDPNNPVSAGTVPTAPGAPVLITQPASATATAGTSVTLNITATGTPAPTYQWQSAPKGSVAFTNIPNATTASLNISALTIADNGKQFRCIVRNEQGSVTSSVSVLTVNAQPSVGFVLANQRVMEGDGTASIAVQLSAPCSRDVAIPFSLSGTALSSTDYTVTQSPLVIPAGATSGEIKVTLVNDSTYQYWDRNVVVTLGTPSNAIKGASAVHTLNIGDDDAIPGVEPQPDGWPLTAEERKYVTTLPYSVRWPNAVDSRATASVADWWGKDGAPNDAYLSKHTQLVETVQRNQGPIDVLLVGDSITQQWGGWFPPTPDDGVTFTKDALWPKEFPQFKTVNIGIGGDKTFGVQWRLRHGGVDGLAPRMVVLAIGTNNLQMGQSLESIAQGVMECVNQLRRKLPSSQVLVMGVLPRNDDANAGALVAPFNEILRKKILNSDGGKLDAQVNWLDIGALMKDANGNLKANVFRDGIHLTQDVGYKIYADALRPVFNNLIPASGNRPPTITPIATQLIAPNGVSAPIPFSVGDSTSSPESLTITATSSNPDVVPVSGIQISGTGANRSLVITPVANKKGSTTVRLSVSDGALTSTCIFDVNVATFTPLSGYVIYQDSIQAGWNDAPSWNVTRNTESSAEVYNGLKSLAVTPTASGGALSLYQSNPISIAPYQSASFAIHGGPSGGQKLQLMLIYTTNGTTSEQNVPITLAGNRWETYTIPLNPPGGTGDTRLQNIRFRDLGTGRQGTYYVDDLTLNLKASAPAPVTITKQPINAVVEVGGNTTFSVAANGNPTPTYQWQSAPKGSSTFANITGATAASYTTSATTTADDGRQFRCIVTNSVGSVTSGVSTLSVNAAPAVTTQAANATVVAGTSATFSVAASGTPTPTYQWQSAPKGSSTFANITGATAASYTTSAATSVDDGRQFRCVVTNSVGSVTSGVSTLNVNAAPAITTQAANATVVAGTSATFSVAASGTPTPTYQWQSAPKGGSTFANISGATASSYTTSAATYVDDGRQFRCVVTNSVGSVTSGVSTLNVNAAPAITTQAANATVVAGTSATFSVAASGTPTPTYQWQSAPKGSSTFANITGATAASYTTSAATSVDDGRQFRCVVTNSVGSVTSGVSTLSVNAAPVITTQATNATVVAGTPATFTVAASGNPTPTYQWQSAPKGSSTFTNISGATASSYTTSAATSVDDGRQFRCVVTNSVGSVTSGVSTLNVNAAPAITTQAANATVVAGTSATFSVAASGNPTPTYQWQSAPKGSSTFANITGATAASYTTSATTTADDGREFRCVVTNSVGSVTSGVSTLSVNAAPVITTQPVSQPVPRGEFARFRVVASGTPAPSYQWQWAPKGSSAFSDITQGTSNTWGTARVNDAIDGRQYRCVVTNSAGSATSDIVTLTMIREAQPTVGFVTATQSLLEGPEPVPNPPILNYPYESYPKAPELALQPVGWPLTEEERTYVLKSEGLRFPGVESNKHLPQLWPVTPMAACWGQTGDTRWLDHHTTLVNTVQANKGAIDILLVGDSLTEYWGGGFSGAPFNAAWKSHFAQYRTVNIGIGGDKTQNILWRLKHGAIDGAAPKVVVLLIGTNNISSTVYNGTPIEAVAQGIKLCVDGLRAKCPNSEIVVVRPFPMGPVGTATFVNGQKINTAVEGLKFENDPKVHILDFYREFFNADGSIKTEYFDSPQSILHLDYVKGYNLYADKLKPMVEQLMAKIAAAEATPKTTPVKVTVKLSAASTQAVTIPFSVGGTAIKSVDYTISASPLTIPAGATSAEIMVMVNDDVAAEIGKETIVITLEATNGATLGTEGVHTIVINDHDLPTPLKAN